MIPARRAAARARFLAALAVAAFAAAPAAADGDTNPYAGNAEAIAEGKRLWADAGCYACHGAEAQGAVGPDLTDDEWRYRPTDRTVFNAIARGRSGTVMVAWSDTLSDDEIWKIVAWIRSLYRGDPDKIVW